MVRVRWILLCLVVGAMVTFGVASACWWSCAGLREPKAARPIHLARLGAELDRQLGYEPVPIDRGDGAVAFTRRGTPLDQIEVRVLEPLDYFGVSVVVGRMSQHGADPHGEVMVAVAGWPWPVVEFGSVSGRTSGAIAVGSTPFPVRPLPVRFAAAMLLYGTVVWAVAAGLIIAWRRCSAAAGRRPADPLQ